MKKRIFPLIITLAALSVSGSAAFYSVFGLSKLFAGASTQVIIMAGSLEFAKLVVASLLYQYWDTINKWLRAYLSIACFVLMVITSGGIYGFLSGAYQSTATQSELLDKSLSILNQKQTRFEETKEDLVIEKTQVNKSISDLRISLATPGTVSYWDENSQSIITTTSSSTRRALQKELDKTIVDRDGINLKLEAVLDSIGKTDMVLLNKEISNEGERELGPLKYLAETTGYPMNQVVNWFLLLIIFVFDPLAIALVIASNMAFTNLKKPEDVEPKDYGDTNFDTDEESDKEEQKEIYEDHFRDLQDYVEATNQEPLDTLTYPKIPTHDPQTGETNPYYKELTGKENPLEASEKRMDIIGQNGNDGLHYEEEKKLSKEIGHKETKVLFRTLEEVSKIIESQPKLKDLENLTKTLNITYNEDNVPLDRLTDTTQTIIDDVKYPDETTDKQKLTYKGRE